MHAGKHETGMQVEYEGINRADENIFRVHFPIRAEASEGTWQSRASAARRIYESDCLTN